MFLSLNIAIERIVSRLDISLDQAEGFLSDWVASGGVLRLQIYPDDGAGYLSEAYEYSEEAIDRCIDRYIRRTAAQPEPHPEVGDQAKVVPVVIETVESQFGELVLEPENQNGTPKHIRRLNKQSAEHFTADYIKREKEAGHSPTMDGLALAAQNAGYRGGREQFLRKAYRKQMQAAGYAVKQGRRKNPPN